MNTLYLHIGTTKTGTTAIQGFCLDNQDVLNQKGYCYPELSLQYKIQYKTISDRRNAHFMIAEPLDNPQSGSFRMGMDKVEEYFKTYPNVILSDEGIWSEPYEQRIALWRALKKEGKQHGFRVKIVVYLRRQDTYLISGWNQTIKSAVGDVVDEPWDEYVKRRPMIGKLDYAHNLGKLATILGRDNILVRRFEPKRFSGGSIYSDFLKTIGLELTDEYRIAESVRNTGLTGNTHEIKRILNGLKGGNAVSQSFFRHALLSIADISEKNYPNSMFSREEAEEFLKAYEEGNRKVAQEYFGEDELFDSSIKDLPKWERNNPYMADDIIRFIGMCCLQLLERQEQMQQEIDSLRKECGQKKKGLSAAGREEKTGAVAKLARAAGRKLGDFK